MLLPCIEVLKTSFRICATLREWLGRKGEDSQSYTGQFSPLKHFPSGGTKTEFDLHSVYIMISQAAAVEGIIQVNNSELLQQGSWHGLHLL